MTIGVVCPDSGNITSVCDALTRLGRPCRILPTPQLDTIDQLILPGQGRFGPLMRYLESSGWATVLKAWLSEGRPFIGICVGMQVLFESSEEDPGTRGLAILRGKVAKPVFPRHPMIGWATVDWTVAGFPPGTAYFVNTFAVPQHDAAIATTCYGVRFCSAVQVGQSFGFQFHPEKSGVFGQEVLRRCLV